VKPRVLIVEDGRGPHPLAAVRSFGAAGWHVGIGSPARHGRAGSSRWAAGWHAVPPAERDPEAFLDAVVAAVAAGRYDVVFGGDDIEVLALSAARDRLGALFPYPPHASVLRSIDKQELTRAAAAAGLAAPVTLSPGADLAELRFPVVVKARMHWTPGQRDVPARLDRTFCATPAEVDAAVRVIEASGGSAIVQEAIEGDLMALTLLLDPEGRRIATVQQATTRLSPYWHNSVRAETVPVDIQLADAAERMLLDLGWWGIANLQFLRPTAGGAPRLIDFNGRFYGSLALARAAGADLPTWWVRSAMDRNATRPVPVIGHPGVRYQSLEEDLRRAFVERRGGLLRDLADTLRYAPGATHSTWSSTDPLPGLRRARRVVRSTGAELVRGAAARVLRRPGPLD
jgi:predicted ATP-grasp superfamily ATP-dependent carboligase